MAKRQPVAFESPFNIYTQGPLLGSGGNGTVYEVTDARADKFALKLMDPEVAKSREKRSRFKNEIMFCRQGYANIVHVLDSGTHKDKDKPGTIFYVMRKYDLTLRKALQTRNEPERLLAILVLVMKGVDRAHRNGTWHRDLKPENILLSADQRDVVVADWGIAHFQEDSLQTLVETKPGDRLANFEYAAPEQRTKGKRVDHRADIYALGLMLNQIFTGVVPHGANAPRIGKVVPDLAALDALVDRMVAHNPEDRPRSVEDVLTELSVLLENAKSNRRIEELKQTKIVADPKYDPLLETPVEIVPSSGDYDPEDRILSVSLSQPVNQQWVLSFGRQPEYTRITEGTTGRVVDPSSCTIHGNNLSVPVSETAAGQVAQLFKQWVRNANLQYRQDAEELRRRQEQVAADEIRRRIENEKRRKAISQSVNESLK